MCNCAFIDQSQLTDTTTFKARAILLLPASIQARRGPGLPGANNPSHRPRHNDARKKSSPKSHPYEVDLSGEITPGTAEGPSPVLPTRLLPPICLPPNQISSPSSGTGRQSQRMTSPIRQIQEGLQPAGKIQRGIPVLLTLDRAAA